MLNCLSACLFCLSLSGDAKLTYFGKWDYVIPCTKEDAVKGLHVAPGKSPDCHMTS